MSESRYDVVVIGTGPGGEGAAMKAAKDGKRVAVIERYRDVGGGCTHWGTIPSKALRFTIRQILDAKRIPMMREAMRDVDCNFQTLLHSADKVISQQVDLRQGFYDRNDIPVIWGDAAFLDEHTLAVSQPSGAFKRIEADHIVIAAGSRPFRPAHVDFTHPRIFDSDTVLSMQNTPFTLTVYGAGVIGCEYASIFRNLGVKVNLINTRSHLLSFLDDEITDALSYHLRDQGVVIRHNETMESIEGVDDGVIVTLASGKKIKSDAFLWANGRSGNSDTLGLENIGIDCDSRGQITVNENYQTSQTHIYAVGDIVGFPCLASASYDQGRFAATHIVEGTCEKRLVSNIPTGIYTSPEISSIGKTERELTEAQVPYEVGSALFRSLARAQIMGERVGMLKLLFHRETFEILGIHCFGVNAAEIIHIGQAIMSRGTAENGNDIRYFVNTTFNYPTMAEAYRVAALNGMNRVF